MCKTKTGNLVTVILYLCMAIPMFFFIDGAITLGGFGFMYHYLFGAGIAAMSFICFLIWPDIRMIGWTIEVSFVLALSYIVPIIISLFIWAVSQSEMSMIIEGSFSCIYVLIAVVVAAGTVYMLRDWAVLVSCIAMSIANVMIIIPVAAEGGISDFINEFVSLVITFGEDTGPLMKSIEIHDLTFAFCLYLMYAIINKKVKGRKTVIVLSLIFSLTGLKRIAVAGILLAVILYALLIKCNKKTVQYISIGIIVIVIAASFAYIAAVQNGLFYFLESKGIDTKGRQLIYSYLGQLFEITPDFIGHGLGFSRQAWNLPLYSRLHQDAYHNEFLRMFIELGFFGYFIWIYFNLPYRFINIFKMQGKKGGLLYLGMALYCCITYATDNTYYYYYMNMAVFILVIYSGHEKFKMEDRRMKNYVDVNDE